jgi:hypothetical protein
MCVGCEQGIVSPHFRSTPGVDVFKKREVPIADMAIDADVRP